MRIGWCAALAACGRIDFASVTVVDDASAPDALPMLAPLQTASASQNGMPAVLHVPIPATTDGSSLIAIAAIDTASQNLSGVYDDAGNTWQRIVDGSDAGLTGRVEIWFVARAKPVTDVELHFFAGLERALAVQISEWPGLADQSPVVGINVAPAAMTAAPTTGIATVGAPALIVGATSINGVPLQPVTSAMPLGVFMHTNVTGAAAYRVAPPGDYEFAWTLSESRYHTAAIVALRLQSP